MTEYPERSYDEGAKLSGWAIGGISFAAAILIVVGFFQIIAGLTAIFDDGFFVVTPNYVFDLDPTAWGWIHLLLGLGVGATGLGLMARSAWAGAVAIGLAMLSAVLNFFTIPYYPFWSILIIALNIWVIWALTRPGAVRS
jgi:hypothetical protein